jgi:23S rRNA pseudouridine955/2504/2580 synthase
MKQSTITKINSGQRADKFVRKWLGDAPLSFIYRLFRKKDVKVNGKWIAIDYSLKEGDVVTIYVTDAQMDEFNKPKPIVPTPFPHQIVYEDDVCLIVNKPKGLLVHGDETEKRLTLANQVLAYLMHSGIAINNEGYCPAPAHRLDRNTSGLVIFGKTLAAQQSFEALFHDRDQIEKHYLALVKGVISKSGKIESYLQKEADKNIVRVTKNKQLGQKAITNYEVRQILDGYTLLDVLIETGRTHQIRVQLADINHPIVGDRKYGDFKVNKLMIDKFDYEHQFLHAYKIVFKDLTGPIAHLSGRTYQAPLPLKEHAIINALAQQGEGA